MQRSTIILAAVALAMAAAPAMAQTTAGVDAYQGRHDTAGGVFTSHLGTITIGNPARTRAIVVARLNEHRFRVANDTMDGETDGGMPMAGAAGGIGN